jgi:hypothetical protein
LFFRGNQKKNSVYYYFDSALAQSRALSRKALMGLDFLAQAIARRLFEPIVFFVS